MSSSRPYRITVRETLREVLVADWVETRMELPPILPPAETGALLAGILRERGFTGDGDTLTRERKGVTTTVHPGTGQVTVSADVDELIDLSEEGDLPACTPCAERAKESLRAGLQEKLRTEADDRQRALQTEATNRLEGALAELGCELERIANQVTSTALKRKAASLGEIKKIIHDNQTGAVTIVVEV
jgi:hypothetical protein